MVQNRECSEGPSEVCRGTLNGKKNHAIIEEEPDDLKNWSQKNKMKFSSMKCKARDWANIEDFCCELQLLEMIEVKGPRLLVHPMRNESHRCDTAMKKPNATSESIR